VLVLFVVKDDIIDPNAPDQGISGRAVSSRVSPRTVKVDADVRPVCDLEPEPLLRIVGPPVIDVTCFIGAISGHGIGELNTRWRGPECDSSWQGEQHGSNKRASMAQGTRMDFDLACL
jgi:hypothetical protein